MEQQKELKKDYAVLPNSTPAGKPISAGMPGGAAEEPAGIYQGASMRAAAVP